MTGRVIRVISPVSAGRGFAGTGGKVTTLPRFTIGLTCPYADWMRVINVRCTQEQVDGLNALLGEQRAAEHAWRAERRKRIHQVATTAAERARLLAAARIEFERLRAAGEFRGSHTLLVLPALRAILAERGWDTRRWRPIPADALRHGRPWGTHDAGYDARVALRLDDALAERITRACYWSSAPAVARLQRWYDDHGDHWRGQLHTTGEPWTGAGPSRADLRERQDLVAKITTTGDIGRAAIDRTLTETEIR